jgi:flavin reductase (DIM6/NTAB) family NADH-FMN oxidoreductase RutF
MSLTHYTAQDVAEMERFTRVNFGNTLSGMRTPFLVGTKGNKGSNLAIFNSIVHIGANPMLLGMVFRPSTVPRHTLENLKATGVYTLNLVSEEMIAAAHMTSAKYPEGVSEFEACGFAERYRNDFPAPFVAESPLQMALSFREEHHIKANDTLFVVGEVLDVFVSSEAVSARGEILHEKLKTSVVSGLDAYYSVKKVAEMPYARPQ